MIDRSNFEAAEANSSLGDRLLTGVRNLWNAVSQLDDKAAKNDKIVKHLLQEVARLDDEIGSLRSEVRGLKISRGKQRAKADRLESILSEATTDLDRTREKLARIN